MNTDPNQIPDSEPKPEPNVDQVYRYLMYGLSLPERTVRSTAAMVGGAIQESASLLVPSAFRDSKTYSTFVQQMLDLVANDVGGVRQNSNEAAENSDGDGAEPTSDPADPKVENYVARKTVGSFIDLAGMATMHVSPLTILAIVSDVAYGTQSYLHELADELKREGVIAEDSTIGNTAELLEAIGAATGGTVDALDIPPISVAGLKETIQQTRDRINQIDATKILPQSEIANMWSSMQSIADKEDVSVFEVSSAMTLFALDQVNTVTKGALTTIRVTGNVLDRHLLDHYWNGLQEIGEKGIYASVAESSRPYIDAVWYNFSSVRPTVTEDLVSGRMAKRAWSGFYDWVSAKKE